MARRTFSDHMALALIQELGESVFLEGSLDLHLRFQAAWAAHCEQVGDAPFAIDLNRQERRVVSICRGNATLAAKQLDKLAAAAKAEYGREMAYADEMGW